MSSIEELRNGNRLYPAVELFLARTADFVSEMSQDGPSLESNNIRTQRAANYLLDVLGFIDSVDHRTTIRMDGTERIQEIVRSGSELFQRYIDGQDSEVK